MIVHLVKGECKGSLASSMMSLWLYDVCYIHFTHGEYCLVSDSSIFNIFRTTLNFDPL